MLKPRIGMTARTGEKCPNSGVWKVVWTPETISTSVSRGNKMPLNEKKSVTWRLIIMFGK